jgi:hypothetical protein
LNRQFEKIPPYVVFNRKYLLDVDAKQMLTGLKEVEGSDEIIFVILFLIEG